MLPVPQGSPTFSPPVFYDGRYFTMIDSENGIVHYYYSIQSFCECCSEDVETDCDWDDLCDEEREAIYESLGIAY